MQSHFKEMYSITRCTIGILNPNMWKLFHSTCNKDIQQLCKVLVSNSNQHNSCVQSVRKCRYESTITDNTSGDVKVYYGTLTPQIHAVKIFSLLSSLTGLAAQPILINQIPNLGTPIVVALFGFVGFFTFVTPFLLHMITKKYVTHIYFNSGTGNYSAIKLSFFLRKKTIVFTRDDVVVPDVPGMFTSFQVKGSSLFVDPRLFEDSTHYARLMGYDKPIDFKMNDSLKDKSDSKNVT